MKSLTILEFAAAYPYAGMSGVPGWTNLEVKRSLERIAVGLAVSNSEYTVAMGFYRRAIGA